jgi:hypothetical protein
MLEAEVVKRERESFDNSFDARLIARKLLLG